MKIRKREKIIGGDIHMLPGDTIQCIYKEEINGHVQEKTLIQSEIERPMTIDEVAIFDLEPGDIPDRDKGIGGVFLEKEEK